MLGTAEGRGVRADYRCLSSAEGERYVWEQLIAGTPFERHLRSSEIEISLSEAGEEHRGRASPPSRCCAGCRGSARR